MERMLNVGDVFGRFTVEEVTDQKTHSGRIYRCRCSCGKLCSIPGPNLWNGNSTSCGCKRNESNRARATHNMSGTYVYRYWSELVKRSKRNELVLHKDWYKFENFINDLGVPTSKHVLGRLDLGKEYIPDNVQWMNKKDIEHISSRCLLIKHDGVTHTAKKWAEILHVPIGRLKAYYKKHNTLTGVNVQKQSSYKLAKTKKTLPLYYYQGEEHTLAEWSKILDVKVDTLQDRVRRNLSGDELFSPCIGSGNPRYPKGERPTIPGIRTVFHDNQDGTSFAILWPDIKITVDTEDVPTLKQYFWRISERGYVETHVKFHGKSKRIFIHRLIMNVLDLDWRKYPIDHVNRIKTDNRKSNLRISSSTKNQINRVYRSNNTSGFIGVRQEGKRWYASICGKRLPGTYDTKEEAIQARKNAEIEFFGESSPYYSEGIKSVKKSNGKTSTTLFCSYHGKQYTVTALAKLLHKNATTIRRYVKQGLTGEEIEKIVTQSHASTYEYQGQYFTVTEICKILNRHPSTIYEHLRNGKSVKDIAEMIKKSNL